MPFPGLPLGGFPDYHLGQKATPEVVRRKKAKGYQGLMQLPPRCRTRGGADPYGSAALTAPHGRAIFREIRIRFFLADLSRGKKTVNAGSARPHGHSEAASQFRAHFHGLLLAGIES